MTQQQLEQYRHLRREVPELRRKIAELSGRGKAFQVVKASRRSEPFDLHTVQVEVPDCATDIRDTLAIMRRRLRRITRQRREVEQFIDNIDDSELRQIYMLRFVEGMNWRDVAQKIGGGNTVSGVRMRVIRHLKLCTMCDSGVL